jgi:hypothetical protein
LAFDLGPNLSVMGSLATIFWLTALCRDGQTVGALAYLRWDAGDAAGAGVGAGWGVGVWVNYAGAGGATTPLIGALPSLSPEKFKRNRLRRERSRQFTD